MSDDTEVEEEDKEEVEEEPKVDPLPQNLDHASLKHLQALREEFREELSRLGAKHDSERAELREHISKLNEYIEDQKKAAESKEKSKDTDNTLVVPPDDIPPEQPNPNPQTKGEPEAPGKKRSRWKSAW
jgi:seryl-tRNA synthetase